MKYNIKSISDEEYLNESKSVDQILRENVVVYGYNSSIVNLTNFSSYIRSSDIPDEVYNIPPENLEELEKQEKLLLPILQNIR